MKITVSGKYPLYVTDRFSSEVEYAISKNTDVGTSEIVTEVGYFIQYLIKGLQNLSNSTNISVGETSYYRIENIGTVQFCLLKESNSCICIFLEDISFDYYGHHPYSHLQESQVVYITESDILQMVEECVSKILCEEYIDHPIYGWNRVKKNFKKGGASKDTLRRLKKSYDRYGEECAKIGKVANNSGFDLWTANKDANSCEKGHGWMYPDYY